MSNAVTVPADKLAELQRDAARYRWLRDRRCQNNRWPHITQYPWHESIDGPQQFLPVHDAAGYHPERLDAWIDAGIAVLLRVVDNARGVQACEPIFRRGVSELAAVIESLRDTGRFSDEEGEATNALEDLLARLTDGVQEVQPAEYRNCHNCAHRDTPDHEWPCRACFTDEKWTPITSGVKTCPALPGARCICQPEEGLECPHGAGVATCPGDGCNGCAGCWKVSETPSESSHGVQEGGNG